MSATDYLEQQIINTHLRGQATHVALCTADPTDTGANEVTPAAFPAYARQAADAGGLAGSGWSDPATSDPTAVKVWLRGGVSGTSYKVELTIDTDRGRRGQVEFRVRVKEK